MMFLFPEQDSTLGLIEWYYEEGFSAVDLYCIHCDNQPNSILDFWINYRKFFIVIGKP